MRGITVEAGRALLIAGAVAIAMLVGCGGNSAELSRALPDAAAVADNPAETLSPPAAAELQSKLDAELSRLAIDPKRGAAAPGAGNAVFDLKAQVIDPDGAGPLPMTGVELSWTERCIGDYDLNGEVNAGDLTPLGQRFGAAVSYLSPGEANGLEWWPLGEPEDDGTAEAPAPPEAGSAAENWRLARIDGNFDGELNLSDVTPIAAHWHERLDGYRVYRKGPQDAQFLLLANPAQPDDPWLTVPRAETYMPGADHPDPLRPLRYRFVDAVPDFGPYEYYVVPFDAGSDAEGSHSASGTARSNRPPLAALALDPPGGIAPLEVMLDASGSSDPDGSIAGYLWDFEGDGFWDLDSGSDALVQHTYTEAAVFRPRVRVRDDQGAAAEASSMLSTTGAPVAQLTATPSEGPAPLTVTLDASASYDPEGTVAAYAWDFDGDGSVDFDSGNDPIIEHTYSGGVYHTQVQVRDGENLVGTAEAVLRVGSPPVAYMTATPETGNVPLWVHFDASASLDPDGEIVEYLWDLNGIAGYEENSGTDPEAGITYHDSGWKTVFVKVTDNSGLSDIFQLRINVNASPEAAIYAYPQTGDPPLEVQLNAGDSEDADGEIVYYQWDILADGTLEGITTAPQFTYTFDETGSYPVRLTVVDDAGATGSMEMNIAATFAPVAVITPALSYGPAPRSLQLDASASTDSDGEIVNYYWRVTQSGVSGYTEYDTGADPSLNLQLNTANSSWGIVLWVTDNLGRTDWVEASASTPDWSAVSLEQALDSHWWYSRYCSLLEADGAPALLYYNITGGSGVTHFSRATQPDGSAWGSPTLMPVTGYAALGESIIMADGLPAVADYENQGGSYRVSYWRAFTTAGESWLRVTADPYVEYPYNALGQVLLALNATKPCMVYWPVSGENLWYLQAEDDAGFTWGDPQAVPVNSRPIGVAHIAGLPCVFYLEWDAGLDTYWLMQIQQLDAASNSWDTPRALSQCGYMAVQGPEYVDGCMSFVLQDNSDSLIFLRAADAAATSWLPPQVIASGSGYSSPGEFRYAVIAGRPTVVYRVYQSLNFMQAIDTSGSTWTPPVVIAGGPSPYPAALADINGAPAVIAFLGDHPIYLTPPD